MSTSPSNSAVGRPTAPLLRLTKVFSGCLDFIEQIDGISRIRVFEIFGGCSHQQAINLLTGRAKHTPPSLRAVNIVAMVIGCPPCRAVIGFPLEPIPVDIAQSMLDAIDTATSSRVVKDIVLRRKRQLLSGRKAAQQ